MSETDTDHDSDHDFNPMLDEVATDQSSSESELDTEEQIMDLRQLVVNLRDQINEMARIIIDFERKEGERESSIEVLRNTVRRLRFTQTQNVENIRARRDNSFFDAVRRKFLNNWQGDIEYITKAQPEHLAFLAALVDLPINETK